MTIQNVSIQNFKSIKDIRFNTKRIIHQKLDKFEILVEDLKNKQIPDVLYLQAVLKK